MWTRFFLSFRCLHVSYFEWYYRRHSQFKVISYSLNRFTQVLNKKINMGIATIVLWHWLFQCLLAAAAEVSAFRPSSFYIVISIKLGIQVMVQLSPVMQVFISAHTSLKGTTSGTTLLFQENTSSIYKIIIDQLCSEKKYWKSVSVCNT